MFGYPTHPSYPWQLQGTPVGGLDPLVPPQILYPDFFRSLPPDTQLGPKGKPVNNRRAFEMSSMKGGVGQDVNDEVINKVNEYQEYMRNIRGRKEGGTVEDQYHPIWQQGFQSGGQPKSDTRDWLREKPEQDTRDWKLARPDTSRTLPEPVTRGWYRAEPDTSRTLSEPDTRDLLFRTQRFAGGGQPEYDPLDRTEDMESTFMFAPRPWMREPQQSDSPGALRRMYDTAKSVAGYVGDGISDAAKNEWERFRGPAKYHPGLYFVDAASRADNALKNATEDWTAKDYWDLATPDMGLRHEYGPMAAPLDVAGIVAAPVMAAGRGLGKATQHAIKYAERDLAPALMKLYGASAAPVATKSAYESYGMAHGGVEDQYHPIWSQNFKDGGGVHDILGTLGGLAGNLIPIPVLGPMLGKFAGHTLGNLIEGGSDEIGDDAARDFSFGMADPDAQGWAFGGPIGPTPPTDDFTSGAEEPGMPSFGPGIPGFDVDMLPVNPQIARDAAERRGLLRQVQADSQKGLAEQMKASSSGGGGGGMGDIMGMAMKMAPQIMSMMASHGGPVGHYADGGSIPAPNGQQPWMYGGGALMARGGYLRGHGGMNG